MDRNALILTPSEEMIKWVNEVFPNDPIDYKSLRGHDSADVFLIDEFDDVPQTIEWLKENYLMFLEEMLVGWVEDEEKWPENLSWELFEKFIEYKIHSVVYDLFADEEGDVDMITFSRN